MRTNKQPPDVLSGGGSVSCPAQVHSALINIAALIAHSVLCSGPSSAKTVEIPLRVYALIGEMLLWEAGRLSTSSSGDARPADQQRIANYDVLGQALRVLACTGRRMDPPGFGRRNPERRD